MYTRIKVLEQKTKAIKLGETPLFFDSVKEYQKALSNNEIKEHHICFIDDVVN